MEVYRVNQGRSQSFPSRLANTLRSGQIHGLGGACVDLKSDCGSQRKIPVLTVDPINTAYCADEAKPSRRLRPITALV